jgi:hypothetical protein
MMTRRNIEPATDCHQSAESAFKAAGDPRYRMT